MGIFDKRKEAPAPAPAQASAQAPARPSIWNTNGGIYFGLAAAAGDDENRPLKDKDKEATARGPIKATFRLTGGEKYYDKDRHVLTIGPNGSGKTRKLLLPNLYRLRDWSCVVIDPKGELAAHTAAFRASRPGHKVLVVDPFGVMPKSYENLFAKHADILASSGFNPVAALDPTSDDFTDDAKAIASALIKVEGNDPYFPQAAQALIKGLVMAVRLMQHSEQKKFEKGEIENPPPPASLGNVRKVLGFAPKDLAGWVKAIISRFGEGWPEVPATLARFAEYNAENREISGVIATAAVQTDWLGSPKMKADLARGAYDFASLKTAPTTVYLVIPPQYLVTHGTFLRLMVASILIPLLRSVEASKVPVLFMLDEFAQLGRMEIIENNYALMRGFGLKVWTVWQDLSQAKTLYKDRWESFISNAGIRQSFAPQDLTTRKYLSEMADDKTNWYEKSTSSTNISGSGGSFGSSQSEQHIKEHILAQRELAALQADESLMFDSQTHIHWSVTPQPELLTQPFPGASKSVAQCLAEARAAIEAV